MSDQPSKNSPQSSQPEAGTAAALARLSTSPCKLVEKEMLDDVPARSGDKIIFIFRICSSPAQLVVFLRQKGNEDSRPLVDQDIRTSDPVPVDLGRLDPGEYRLTWAFNPGAEAWEVLGELAVNDVVRFRRFKSTEESRIPTNFGFIAIEVLP
ncbi:MAG: hypothetical protein AAGC60_05465 [Acidobacteriota bacterium]